MFAFRGVDGFKQFVRGNLNHGDGVRDQTLKLDAGGGNSGGGARDDP